MLQDAARTYEQHAWFQGRILVGTALAIFIVPLACSVAGAHLAARYFSPEPEAAQSLQMIGFAVGLALGLALAKLLVWMAQLTRFVSCDGDRQ